MKIYFRIDKQYVETLFSLLCKQAKKLCQHACKKITARYHSVILPLLIVTYVVYNDSNYKTLSCIVELYFIITVSRFMFNLSQNIEYQ